MVIPGMIFEDMGIMYLGPVDGHDISAMLKVFQEASQATGTGLSACSYQERDMATARQNDIRPVSTVRHLLILRQGLPLSHGKATYTDVFSTVMRKMGDRDDKLVAITAAMADGCGLKRFHNMFPDRFFDVGIAEEHAVTFAAALAAGGMHPVFAVYSSFLQRGYDQMLA